MEGKIIAVWGSPHSGKTTFATKLATAIYSSFESLGTANSPYVTQEPLLLLQ